MNMFSWMLVGHMVGDFLLQTGWMAKKTINITSLLTHCLVYTLTIYIAVLPAGGLSLKAIIVIFASHIVLDHRKFVLFWVRRVNNAESLPWMNIVIDQCFHLLVLALTAQYLN
ncbi:MAG: hypothetical protein A4E52_02163 [Pelotomaculum sp. PtaB.Bin013]|uniref:DUF3307 domain-containing protein n=1 Tax=Pelotomaculum isophthalicicum JI TaxID=947010 RepID=A0A9X4JTE1_9FIRM|nr:DUF3307 domain-containing protein [Pelotomaculum isophthalicicum]MDF9408619.1 DUF3307 domain-containing protein [Pelotomaculum isophthalicicum JI]OPX81749.1 MAG: hypothetical protein A4E52_02163 [Pelotomaculum sp. PtaB.Bin013]